MIARSSSIVGSAVNNAIVPGLAEVNAPEAVLKLITSLPIVSIFESSIAYLKDPVPLSFVVSTV